MRIPFVLAGFLSLLVERAIAGQCMSICQQNDDDPEPCPQPQPIPVPQDPKWRPCQNKPPEGDEWACQADDLTYPNVACILADMQTCGNVGENTVFYSFGVTTVMARTGLRDTLQPQGTMFNDALDEDVSCSYMSNKSG